jgi:TetR/AcrR family transcriptional regulator, transcriptional repressor for nem operon
MVQAAAGLMHVQGVQATTVDQVLEASGTGKSQFYNCFDSKEHLVRTVLEYQAESWLERTTPMMARLDTLDGFAEWFARIQHFQAKRGYVGGCPVGSMAAEMADADTELRPDLAHVFEVRRGLIEIGLTRMRAAGLLNAEADPESLSRFVLAAIQGGLLLASTQKSGDPLRDSLAATLDHLRFFAAREDA